MTPERALELQAASDNLDAWVAAHLGHGVENIQTTSHLAGAPGGSTNDLGVPCGADCQTAFWDTALDPDLDGGCSGQADMGAWVLDHVTFGPVVDEAFESIGRLLARQDIDGAMRLYAPMIAYLVRMGQCSRAMGLSQRVLDAAPLASVSASRCMTDLGACHQTLGDIPKAIDLHQRALATAEQLEDLAGQAKVLGNLGRCYHSLSDIPKAIALLERALAIDEQLGHLTAQANDLGNLGRCYETLADIAKAIDLHERALTIADQLHHLAGQANALNNLGRCYHVLGQRNRETWKFGQNLPKAIALLERALAIDEQLGHLLGQANALRNLGRCHLTRGIYDKSKDFLGRALALDGRLGHLAGQAADLGGLGLCTYYSYHHIPGHFEFPKAFEFLERALAIEKQLGSLEGQAIQLAEVGWLHAEQGLGEIGRGLLEQALAIYLQMGLPDDHPEVDWIRERLTEPFRNRKKRVKWVKRTAP